MYFHFMQFLKYLIEPFLRPLRLNFEILTSKKKNPGQKRLLLTSGMYGSLCRTNSYGNMNYPSTPTPQVLRPSFGLDVSYDLKSLELKTLTRKYGTYYWIYILHIIMKTQILNDNQIIKNQSYLVRCLPLFLQHKLY